MAKEIKDEELGKIAGGDQTEENDGKYVCQICGKQFDNILALAAHQMGEHREPGEFNDPVPNPNDMLN